MTISRYGSHRPTRSVGGRVPAEIYDKFTAKHPNKGDMARVIRALVQMYVEGKITNLKYIQIDTI